MADFDTNYSVVNRVLVVEDDPVQRDHIKGVLSAAGFSVETAKDGGQAHAAVAMNKPDFVILDLILPNESGFEVCERIKQQDSAIPVMVYSEIKLEDAKLLAARVGADDYLAKPASDEQLVTEVRRVAEELWRKLHLDPPSDSGEKVRFPCPHCEVKMKVKGSHRGRQLTCPNCGVRITVPRV